MQVSPLSLSLSPGVVWRMHIQNVLSVSGNANKEHEGCTDETLLYVSCIYIWRMHAMNHIGLADKSAFRSIF